VKNSPRHVEQRLAALQQRCRESGMNLTPQRIAIYRALVEAEDHPSPEELFERVRPGMPTLSLGTIYKTLEALARLDLVAELPATGDRRRYDANMQRHHHLICTRCGRVMDYDDPGLSRLPPPARIPGFEAHHVSVHVHGLCASCARGRKAH